MSTRPLAVELRQNPDAVLLRTDLAQLGHGRAHIDQIFKLLPNVVIPGCKRPMIYARDYVALMADSTYRGDRVRPT